VLYYKSQKSSKSENIYQIYFLFGFFGVVHWLFIRGLSDLPFQDELR